MINIKRAYDGEEYGASNDDLSSFFEQTRGTAERKMKNTASACSRRKKIKSTRVDTLDFLLRFPSLPPSGARVTARCLEFSILRFLMSKYPKYDGKSMIAFPHRRK